VIVVYRSGEHIHQNALADGQGRLQVHDEEGRLCLRAEESQTGTGRRHENAAESRSTRRNRVTTITSLHRHCSLHCSKILCLIVSLEYWPAINQQTDDRADWRQSAQNAYTQ